MKDFLEQNRGYLIPIFLLILLFLNIFLLIYIGSFILQSSHTVNIAGSQRLHAREIESLSNQILIGNSTADVNLTSIAKNLENTTNLFEIKHNALVNGSETLGVSEPPPEVEEIYYEEPYKLNQLAINYMNLARSVVTSIENDETINTKNIHSIRNLSTPLIEILDIMVQTFAEEFEEDTKYFFAIQIVTTVISIILFLISIKWIYRFRNLEQKLQIETMSNRIEDLQLTSNNLKRSKKQYQELFNAAPFGIIFRIDEEIKIANTTIADMLGKSKTDLMGMSVFDFMDEQSAQKILLRMQIREQNNQSYDSYEINLFDNNQGKFPVNIYVKTAELTLGKGHIVFIEDLRKIKQTEQKLMETKQQLQQFQQLENIEKLAGGIAHDFNNLLSVMQGNAQLALTTLDEDLQAREDIQEIINAISDASELTQQLLTLGRRKVVHLKQIDLNELIKDTSNLLKRTIGESIELETNTLAEPAPVKLDRSLFNQVLINLAINARDAMPQGGKLTISSKRMEIPNPKFVETLKTMYVLNIEDTGIGMEKETLSRLFEPFFTTKSDGTGLGMTMVLSILDDLKGDIEVSSAKNEGTSIKIYLPKSDEKAKPEQKTDKKFELINQHHILIVEDNEDISNYMAKLLQDDNQNVTVANTPKDAIELFESSNDFEVIISDIIMPEMSGIELLENIHQRDPEQDIIFMSGYSKDREDIKKIEEEGYRFLEKPFSYQELVFHLYQILEN